MATLEVQAYAAADELIAEHGGNVVMRSRLVLVLAWLQGYGAGVQDGKLIADKVFENIYAELSK